MAKKPSAKPSAATSTAVLAQLHARVTRALQAGAMAEAARLLADAPKNPNFDMLRGIQQHLLGQHQQALVYFDAVLAKSPDHTEALLNWAQCQLRLRQAAAVVTRLAPIATAKKLAAAFVLLAEAYEQQHNLPAATTALGNAIEYGLKSREIISNYWLNRRKLCDWHEPLPSFTAAQLTPAAATVLSDSPALQRLVAEDWCRMALPPVAPARAKPAVHNRRLRLGYLSADIHHHATAYLTAELFALHNRNSFEVFCFSYGRPDDSAVRTRIKSTAEHFVELHDLPPLQALQQLHASALDVLVDLKGHTRGHALPWLCSRVAPVQIHYLGHPGTIGGAGIDYLVGDALVTPENAAHFYTEKILRHPLCYQINDRARPIGPTLPRTAYGLPENGVVLACFNQTYKITPEVFQQWCALLQARPACVLWLYSGGNETAENNLRAAANAAGINPARLIFCAATDNAAHLARYRVVDLVLDTYPYGSHTTASDALWAGTPLITRMGETYPSRVAASLLHHVGLPQLITTTPAAYQALALSLIDDAAARADLRAHLATARNTAPLFDTAGWVKAWEEILQGLVQ